jgi:uncharacterized membrane protein
MDAYTFLKWLHIMSSTLLFGTGLGTAFHGWMSHRTRDPHVIAAVGRSVVLADWLFTTPAVIVQPVTGAIMIWLAGYPLTSSWLVVALALYVLVGLCWLPVVWIQIQIHRIAKRALATGQPLGADFQRFTRVWFLLGWPAFISVIAIFWIMVAKPDFW